MQIRMHRFFQSRSGAVLGDWNPSTLQADSSAGSCAAAGPLSYLDGGAAGLGGRPNHWHDPVVAS